MQRTDGESYKCSFLGFQNSFWQSPVTMAWTDELSPYLPSLIHIPKEGENLAGDKENCIKWAKWQCHTHASRIPARRVTLCGRALARTRDDAAAFPHLFYTAGHSRKTPDKSHLSALPTFFWVMLLWSGCDASAVSATIPWKPFGSVEHCRHPREAGWSSRKPCEPPASPDPLRHFWGRWNLYLYSGQYKKGWSEAGMVTWIWILFIVKKEKKNQSCSRLFFLIIKHFTWNTGLWKHATQRTAPIRHSSWDPYSSGRLRSLESNN